MEILGRKLERNRCLIALGLAVCLSSCGFLPSDPNSQQLNPYRGPLRVTEINPPPGTIGTDPTLEVRFSNYLAEESFKSYNVLFLQSGGRQYAGEATYSPVRKTLYWQPFQKLPEGLRLQIRLNDKLKPEANIEKDISLPNIPFLTKTGHNSSENELSSKIRWPQIEKIFETRCRDCHSDDSRNPLTYRKLVGNESDQTDRFLIKPYEPSNSYVLQKLLWDYPGIRYAPQPPPWSKRGKHLPLDELIKIERWITQGAKP